jgi:spoIIIJ-associated protein
VDTVEASGKTVDDAILQALARLGRRRDEVNIEVLQEPSRGSFGLGIRDARVRVTVKSRRASSGAVVTPEMADALLGFGDAPAPAPTAPPQSPGRAQPPRTSGRAQPPARTPAPPSPQPPAPRAAPPVEEFEEEEFEDEELEEGEEYEDEEEFEEEFEDEEEQPFASPRAALKPLPPEEVESAEGFPEGESGPASKEIVATAVEVLQTILQHMQVRGRVEIRSRDPLTLNVRLDDGLGLLIGRRGETLGSLQLIVNLIVSHRTKHRQRIVVDVDNYKLRREENLQQLAFRVAQQVQQSRRAIPLEAMPPNERRIVHMTLSDHPVVMTHSEGEGDQRRVIISLRKPTGR